MSAQEHMDRGMLKEKLGNYRADPPEKVWDAISGQIAHGRRRRGMYILLLASAASIALAISLGIYFFGPDLPQEQAGVTEQAGVREQADVPETSRQEGEPAEIIRDRDTEDGQSEAGKPGPDPSGIQERGQVLAVQEMDRLEGAVQEEIELQEAITDTEEYMDQETIADMEEAPDPDPELQPDTALEINMDPFPFLEEEKKRNSSWMVGAAVSPLYSYRDAEDVDIPADQAESGLLSYSTGIHVRYRRNSRLAFETGIYFNRTGIAIGAPGIQVFSQRKDYMLFGVGSESADINTVSNSVGNIVVHSGDIYLNGYLVNSQNGGDDFQSEIADDVQYAEYGIQQHLDYLELPFNLRYSVIDRTFVLQLVGGVSTNFLVGNSVTMEGSAGREEIGYLSNVNTVNYSGNAGLGMIYHLGKNLSLSLEPRFRYFLNSVNDATLPATRPYSLGFYTGLSYTF